MSSIVGAVLVVPDRQPLSRRQQRIIRRFVLRIKLPGAGYSSSGATVFSARKFPASILGPVVISPGRTMQG